MAVFSLPSSVLASPSTEPSAVPSVPSVVASPSAAASSVFSGSITIVGEATVAITKSLPVIVGTTLFGGGVYVIPAETYSLIMFATSLIFVFFVRKTNN